MTLYRARTLDENGRCCGRKPIVYKRDRHLFCPRCDSTFDIDGKFQIKNWAWQPAGGAFFPTYPESEAVTVYSKDYRIGEAI